LFSTSCKDAEKRLAQNTRTADSYEVSPGMLRHAAKHFALAAFIQKCHSLLTGIFVNDGKDEDGVGNSDILLKDESNENHRVSFT
jgi:hypothetical protein